MHVPQFNPQMERDTVDIHMNDAKTISIGYHTSRLIYVHNEKIKSLINKFYLLNHLYIINFHHSRSIFVIRNL